ncbi:MAG: DUF885 family protein, partial [Flammeovirgaceae bacterium]|nr:DUF885 family protein [Flammeovirgaceae bacterium]
MKKYLLLFFCIFACQSPSDNKAVSAADQLAQFLETFSSSPGRGRKKPDDDLSKSSFDAALTKTKEQLATLRTIDSAQLKGDDLIDWKFAQSILVGRELEQEKMQAWKRDPRLFMTFTGISDVINQPGDAAGKIEQIKKRLAITPTQLENGMKLLDTYVPRFQELALFMAENGYALFDKEIPAFAKLAGAEEAAILDLAKVARQSLEKFILFIKNELPQKQNGDFAIGYDTYNQMLRGQYLISYSSDSLYEYGWKMFNQTVGELEQLAKKIDPTKTWQQLIKEIKTEGPPPEKMIEAHQEWVDKAGEHIRKH